MTDVGKAERRGAVDDGAAEMDLRCPSAGHIATTRAPRAASQSLRAMIDTDEWSYNKL